MSCGLIKRLVALLLFVSLTAACLNSCDMIKKKEYKEYYFDYFDTVTTVIGYESNRADFERIADIVEEKLSQYHKLYDIYTSYEGINNLATVNSVRGSAEKPIKVDRAIIDLLLYAKEAHALTGGKMNIAMGSVLSIWHKYRNAGMSNPEEATLPTGDELLAAARHTDIDALVIDEENCTVYLSDSEMLLDVGAVAKGYAAEQVCRYLEEQGISGYLLNVGGNVRCVGRRNNNLWDVAIENPDTKDSNNPYVDVLSLESESLVTSGAYQRYYEVQGKRYHHVIDSDTLYPSERYLSVSVVCSDSGLGDVLSTALFCMDIEEGMALVEGIQSVECLWILPDGERVYSEGFSLHLK